VSEAGSEESQLNRDTFRCPVHRLAYTSLQRSILVNFIIRAPREKLVRERGAGSRDFISKIFGILTTMARQTYYHGL
jgi:hypothetical protein